MKNLYLFDFDGVVVDSLEVYEETVRECLDKIGRPLIKNRKDFLELFDDNFYESLVKRGVDLTSFMETSVDILARVNYAEMKIFPDLIPVLAKLQEENILAIISSSDSQDINVIMTRFHLSSYFRDVLGSDVNFDKKEKILYIIDKYGMQKDNTYYVGDTVGDIKEAKTAEVKTIAVCWGWHSRERLAAATPDYLIERPEELLEI